MRAPRQTGFSLLELLVALVVVVLITSLVSLSLSSGGQEVELEAKVRNLADVAVYALDEAQMLGRDYGLVLQRDDEEGELVYVYSWRERLDDGWQEPASGKDVFAPQRFPAEVELQLELEDAALLDLPLAEAGEDTLPQMVMYASGEMTAGAVDVRRIEDGELLWRVEWDLLGRVEVLRNGLPAEDSL